MLVFQTPIGVKDELFKEFQTKKHILDKVEKIFSSFGYREVSTPTIEYYDIFRSMNSTVLKDDIFKFIDHSGEILALRPDATIPIARIVANYYKENKRNYKLWYKTQVFKMSSEKKREVTQTGVEYFGNISTESDAEIIVMAINSLKELKMNFKIELGNAGYLKNFLKDLNLTTQEKEKLKEHIEKKNLVELRGLLKKIDIEENIKEIIMKIPNLYGEVDIVLEEARKNCLNSDMEKSLEETIEIVNILKDFGVEKYISMDLGLINHIDYYTGIVFKGYVENYGDIILSGGRYDDLTRYYGESIPATGFAINVDDLVNIIYKNKIDVNLNSEGIIDYCLNYKTELRKEAIDLATVLRENGYRVDLRKVANIENITYDIEYRKNIILDNDKVILLEENISLDKDEFKKNIIEEREI